MKFFCKILFVSLLFFTISATTIAQEGMNLVPNPSFEEYSQCPQFYGDVDASCEYWRGFKGSPDYMHSCNPTIEADLVGSLQPHSGDAYVGFLTYGITTPDFLREQVGVELASPLIIGETYYVSFFISLAYVPSICNIATNNIGALFTTYPYFDPMLEIPNLNFSHINESSIISENDWVKISGSFVADSAYTYLVIGNFYDDIHTDTLNLPYTVAQQRAYYCVDDVCVTTDSLYNEMWQGIVSVQENVNNSRIVCYPNPANDFLNIKSDVTVRSIELFNYLGQSVLTMNNLREQLLTIPVNQYPAGYYVLKINSSNQTQFIKILIN